MAALPTETGVEDLMITAIVSLLTSKLQTEVDTGDVSRALLIKAGPRQAAPESVTVLVHENDPDDPFRWSHKPMSFKVPRQAGGLVGDPYADQSHLRVTAGRTLIGGGSLYSRAFTLEIEVFGLYFPEIGAAVERQDVRRVASVVTRRAIHALQEAGPKIGTGSAIRDDFGEMVVEGPFLGASWTDPEEGESLLVRKFVQVWYRTASSWSTDAW